MNAATVYEKDGFTYKLNGDFQIQFRQATGFDERAEVEYDDMELKNYVAYDLGNDLTAFGRLDVGYHKSAAGSPDAREGGGGQGGTRRSMGCRGQALS